MSGRSNSHLTFAEKYRCGQIVGVGSFAVVHTVTDLETNEDSACKVIYVCDEPNTKWEVDVGCTASITACSRWAALRELKALSLASGTGVARLKEYFEENNFFYIIMELVDGCDLMSLLEECLTLDEPQVRDIARQVLLTLRDLHSRGVVHRDVKPENIMVSFEPEYSNGVKLVDFGLADIIPSSGCLSEVCGTLPFVAPEILLRKGYGVECDIWSLGITLHILLFGEHPFGCKDCEMIPYFGAALVKGSVDIQSSTSYLERAVRISRQGRELLSKMLEFQPSMRISASSALQHPWLSENWRS